MVEATSRTCGDHSGRDPEGARELLARLLRPITLRRDGDKVVAEMKGNLPALLETNGGTLYNPGSPSPLRVLYNWPALRSACWIRRSISSSVVCNAVGR